VIRPCSPSSADFFQQVGATSPGIRDAVIVSLARRLAQHVGEDARAPSSVRTVAIVPAGGSGPSSSVIDRTTALPPGGSAE
jgi:hypothetical protein